MSEHHHTASALRPPAAHFMTAGALLMLLAVMLGTFGAHALQATLAPRQLASYQTGVTYHLFHALALVVLGGLAQVTRPTPWLSRAGLLLGAGIVLFSGSIYAMALGAPRWLGMVAPLGGTSFMLGWIALALHARASR
jgi:uncharacterized membrane protein YgdD (TMEM256/DUF423 family)